MSLLVLAAESVPEVSFTRDANWFLENVWIVPLLPALSFLGILFFGKRLPRGGAELGIAALGLAFLFAVVANIAWFDHRDNYDYRDAEPATELDHSAGVGDTVLDIDGESDTVVLAAAEESEGGEEAHPAVAVLKGRTWFENGGVAFAVGTLLDGSSVMMLFVVTLISLLVHVYSTDYVKGDVRFTHFFAFLSLFSSSMLFFVLSRSTIQLITAWELVGVCSFVLIGHWWEEKPNSDAALKAFLTNRVGDIGLLVGMIILFFAAGNTFDIVTINEKAVAGEISQTALTWAAISLTAAVMSKSGQFILHTWLPDAMAGPTPVSALIHAATMVVAGVFMIARLYPVFYEGFGIADNSVNGLAVIGAVTVVFGGLLAFVQDDIKKVLAYSTVSQLGYMVLALGVGAYTAALFHLFTHAFFKAGLFLGSGSVAHSVHSFDMKKDMGGMRKFLPTPFITFLICSISLAGVFPLAGFWSKDEILVGTGGLGVGADKANGSYHLMLIMGLVGAALTGAYMTRCIYLTFFGEFRGHGHPHESGRAITVPLIILSVFAVGAGFLNLPPGFLAGSAEEPTGWQERFGHFVEPAAAYFPPIGHAVPSWGLAIIASIIGLAGPAVAYWYYFVKVDGLAKQTGEKLTELPNGITSRNAWAGAGHAVLVNKYYLDHLYNDVIVAGVKGPLARVAYWFNQNVLDGVVDGAADGAVRSGRFVYDNIDQKVVDGAVNGSGFLSSQSGQGLRRMQTGKVQQYAALLFAGATILAGIFIVVI
ncbi:MAG: NADH-quinone oxidoreductase subunit L [Acidimicrobiia bacterium]|nr:NADH-quinone oxidoreductase subunit L [Acidimicrobiia bacterium]